MQKSVEYKVSILCQDISKILFCIWMCSTYFLSPKLLNSIWSQKMKILTA